MPVAQFNLGYLKYDRDTPEMRSYMVQLEKVMQIAENDPGLIWIHDDNTVEQVYKIFGRKHNPVANLSTWIDVEHLRKFMFSEMHSKVMNRREEWFMPFDDETFVMWHISEHYRPTIEEAHERLKNIRRLGQTDFAFNDLFNYPKLPEF